MSTNQRLTVDTTWFPRNLRFATSSWRSIRMSRPQQYPFDPYQPAAQSSQPARQHSHPGYPAQRGMVPPSATQYAAPHSAPRQPNPTTSFPQPQLQIHQRDGFTGTQQRPPATTGVNMPSQGGDQSNARTTSQLSGPPSMQYSSNQIASHMHGSISQQSVRPPSSHPTNPMANPYVSQTARPLTTQPGLPPQSLPNAQQFNRHSPQIASQTAPPIGPQPVAMSTVSQPTGPPVGGASSARVTAGIGRPGQRQYPSMVYQVGSGQGPVRPSGSVLVSTASQGGGQQTLVSGQFSGMGPPPTGMVLSGEQAAMGPPVGPPVSHGGPPVSHGLPPTGGPPTGTQSVFSGKPRSRYPEMPAAAVDAVESQPSQPQATPTHPSLGQPAPPVHHRGVSDIMSGVGRMEVEQKALESFNLLEQRHIVPQYPKELTNPEIDNKKNCLGQVFSCTLNAVPETQGLLDKSRLPFGIHLHPFKELPEEDLPVIQNEAITRCRSCRTYINPFVAFVDQRRWQCNVCFRTNDSYEDLDYNHQHGRGSSRDTKPEMRNCVIEYVAPSEYMIRPPQPSVFVFLLDVSNTALETGYLPVFCKCLRGQLDRLPGDSRMMIGVMTFNSSLHYYSLKAGLSQPQMMVISDLDDQFFPSPEGLLVNLKESRELVESLLEQLPSMFDKVTVPYDPNSAVGPALLSAFKLVSPYGGRITLIQTTLPNCGEGQLKAREDSSQLRLQPQDVLHLQPATDFYKKLALDCSQQQIAIDLFLLASTYSDLSSISAACKFSSGCVNYYRNFSVTNNPAVARKFERDFCRYLTRPVGFEAVMRIRCTRGLVLHAFHGNCFIRSTDLLSLPNVNPDLGFSIQLAIEESLKDIPYACFQAALLYTNSKGERRIRVHSLVLPITRNLQQIYANANQHAIIGLVSKMAVDRSLASSVGEARDGIINVLLDVLTSYGALQPSHQHSGQLLMPVSLSLLALHLQSLLKHTAFRLSGGTPVDERVYSMNLLKCLPLDQHILYIYPRMYALHEITEDCVIQMRDGPFYQVPVLQLSAERISRKGAYLIDSGQELIVWIGKEVSDEFCVELFAKDNYSILPECTSSFPNLETSRSKCVCGFVKQLQDSRPNHASLYILREDSRVRGLFTRHLLDDRTESSTSYYEFLVHVQKQVTK